MITKEQAIAAHHGQNFYGFGVKPGRVIRIRKSGNVKTWKTRPNDWQMPVKFGLYENAYMVPPNMSSWVPNSITADNWYMTEDEANAVLASRQVRSNPRRRPQGAGGKLKSTVITGPAYWASYLVNGDASGLEPGEKERADAWLAQQGNWSIVSTVDDAEPRFTWHYQLYGGDAQGGEVIDYVALGEGD